MHIRRVFHGGERSRHDRIWHPFECPIDVVTWRLFVACPFPDASSINAPLTLTTGASRLRSPQGIDHDSSLPAALSSAAFVLLFLAWGTPAQAGPTCPVLVLNGTTRYATAAGSVYPTSTSIVSFTAEAWIYPTEMKTQTILSDDAWDLRLDLASASLMRLAVGFRSASGNPTSQTMFETRNVTINQWHYVAMSFNGSTKQIWFALDGAATLFPFTVSVPNFRTAADTFSVGFVSDQSLFTVTSTKFASRTRCATRRISPRPTR